MVHVGEQGDALAINYAVRAIEVRVRAVVHRLLSVRGASNEELVLWRGPVLRLPGGRIALCAQYKGRDEEFSDVRVGRG